MIQVLIKNKKYSGKYVALKDFHNHTVIGLGKTIHAAYKKAAEKGCKDPVIFYVPPKDSVQIY